DPRGRGGLRPGAGRGAHLRRPHPGIDLPSQPPPVSRRRGAAYHGWRHRSGRSAAGPRPEEDVVTDPAELLDTAKRAASLGRNLLLDGKTGQVTAKSERDYVSELDVRIERVIREHLAEVTPEIGFLGE